MDRREVAHVLRTIGALLEIKGEEGFKTRAYERAAESLLARDYDLAAMARDDRLLEIPGIGKNLEPKVREMIETGRSSYLERLVREVPEGLLDLLRVPGIGPKTARLIHESLGVSSLPDLKVALKEHRIQRLPGLGKKREELMERGLREIEKYSGRLSIGTALPLLEEIAAALSSHGVLSVIVGETARYEETVASLEMLISGAAGETPSETLVRTGIVASSAVPSVEEGWDPEESAFTLRTSFGVPLRLHFEDERAFWARAVVLIGPPAFIAFLSARAEEKGCHLRRHGLYRDGRPAVVRDESTLFEMAGMLFVPPEVRHRPEMVGLASVGGDDRRSPEAPFDFVSTEDLGGDLHVHTSWSDGVGGIEDVAREAARLGYSYVAITDHATDIKLIRGLTAERLEAQVREIREMSRKYPEIRILTGVEVDILRDGRLYLPDEILAGLDVVVASVHQDIGDRQGELVNRLVGAARDPNVDIIGHPTGRLIGRRAGSLSGLEPVFEEAARHGTALEINASPERLDLPEELVISAARAGAKFAVCTDAHSPGALRDMRFGVHASARRAGIGKGSVVNAKGRTPGLPTS